MSGGQIGINHCHIIDSLKRLPLKNTSHISTYFSDVIFGFESNENVSFGFYNSLILFLVIIITLSKGLHFFQDLIIEKLPFTKFYINYF